MKLIDANTVVTFQTCDVEHEEYQMESITIADALDRWSEEGCPPEVTGPNVQSPRVMALEEAKSASGYVIVQSRTCNILELRWIKDRFVYDSFAVPIAVDDLWWEGYNKHWRLWTSVPTDEQREATPWN